MVEISGSQAVWKSLEKEDVNTLFGLPGGSVIPLLDEFLKFDLRFILARHEHGAAHMADGFARASWKVGVCLSTSGPGATNLITGLASDQIS